MSIAIPGLAAGARAEVVGTQLPGTLTFTPDHGTDQQPIVVTTPGTCPGGTNVQVRVFGAGFPTDGQNVSPDNDRTIFATDPSTGGYQIPFSDTLGSFAAQQVPPATLSGVYTVWVLCRPHIGLTDFGYFAGAIDFTSPTTYVLGTGAPIAPTVVPTAITLPVGTLVRTSPAATWTRDGAVVGHGTTYTLAAHDVGHLVTAPGGPAIAVVLGAPLRALVPPSLVGTGKVGTKLVLSAGVWTPPLTAKAVEWKRDGKVIKGRTGTSYVVKPGDKGHKISALVTAKRAGYANGKAASAPIKGSATAKVKHLALVGSLAVVKPVAVSLAGGLTVPVGSPIGCKAATFNAVAGTTSWLVNGVPTGSQSFVIPAADLGKTLTCRTSATVGGVATVQDAVVHVGAGAALATFVKPHVGGTAKVGKKLTVTAGKWTPAPTKVTYQWLVGGKVIKGATKATFVVPAKDRHKAISVRVTATKKGWLSGKVATAAVRIA